MNQIKCARFAGEDVRGAIETVLGHGGLHLAEAERSETERVTHADEFILTHDDQRVRALNAAHDAFHRVGAVVVTGFGE